MILMLDFVAERYGMLPSQVLKEGNSLDFVIAEAAQGYKNKLQAKANNKSTDLNDQYSQSELLDILNRSRGQK